MMILNFYWCRKLNILTAAETGIEPSKKKSGINFNPLFDNKTLLTRKTCSNKVFRK
jgi:hypothetical protein